MFQFLANLLAWFYQLWPSYGMAIVFLTLTIMVALTPLTLKGTRSMMVMQAMQPEMKRIQQRFKDDRQKLNEELLAFYKENKINPLGGCLPLLIQMPVFLVLYRVLRGLTETQQWGVVMDATHQVAPGACSSNGCAGFNPAYISHKSDLFNSLWGQHEMVSWGMDLSQSATAALRDGFAVALPYLVLVLAVVGTSYYQQKQVSGRNPNAAAMNPQQQMLLRVMPLFFGIISLNLPAALVIYFLVSNVYRVGQQAFISHKIYKPAVAQGLFDTTGREKDDKELKEPAPAPRSAKSGSAPGKVKDGAKDGAKDGGPATPAPAAAATGGFFGRLLGGAAPRPGQASGAKQTSSKNGGAAKPASRTASAAPTRPGSGRVTPSGSGPQPRARKKKKRK
jgi:YidC/Oxa1 family membrane protein insertase